MFPGSHAQIYYNDDGEPIGWDYPSSDYYDHDDWWQDDGRGGTIWEDEEEE